jgi:microcystin-dependent protein
MMVNHIKLAIVLIAIIAATLLSATAQVGINTLNPDSTALLDIRYSGDAGVGVLLPDLNDGSRKNKRYNVSDGMVVFDRTRKMLYYYDASIDQWIAMSLLGSVHDDNGLQDIRPQDDDVNGCNMSLGLPKGTKAAAKLDVGGSVKVRKDIIIDSNAFVNQNLLVSGHSTLQKTLQVNGKTTLKDTVTFSKALTVNANINAGNNTINAGVVNASSGYGITPIGGIIMWSGTDEPEGWAICDGRMKNGRTTPNLRGRFIVGHNPASLATPKNVTTQKTENYGTIGNTGGEALHILITSEMPSHSHTALYTQGVRHNDGGKEYAPISGFIQGEVKNERKLVGNTTGDGGRTNNTGDGSTHENRPPYYVLAFIMRVQ